MNKNLYFFLQLVRLGIGHSATQTVKSVDWQEIQTVAEKQGLYAVVLDGIEKLPESSRPPQVVLLEWIGEVLQRYEYRYEQYSKAISELANFYNCHGLKMMVLKGYACSLNWPKPEHRPCGDIDIWQFGRQKEADAALTAWFKSSNDSKVKGFKIDNSHHHHSVFYWRNFMVENHYDFVNVHVRKSSKELEDMFKELGKDDSHFVELYGEKVYIPSPNLHALFLIRHMVSHFVGANISMRQVLDWAFFVEKHTKEVDWNWLLSILDRYHMRGFFNCINAISVEDLGFDVSIFPSVQFEPCMKERVQNDILDPAFATEEPRGLIKRMLYKYHRWQGNAWKQEMCYCESRWSTFWTGIWAKLLKPKSI